jgi:hypothetical protein
MSIISNDKEIYKSIDESQSLIVNLIKSSADSESSLIDAFLKKYCIIGILNDIKPREKQTNQTQKQSSYGDDWYDISFVNLPIDFLDIERKDFANYFPHLKKEFSKLSNQLTDRSFYKVKFLVLENFFS